MGVFDNQKTGVRILFGVIIGMLAMSMLLYLVPQGPDSSQAAGDVVAKVGDQTVTLADVTQQLNEIRQHNQIPRQLEALYANQILKQLVFQKEIEYEAKRLGITVTDKERADRIRQFLPAAFNGDTFVGMELTNPAIDFISLARSLGVPAERAATVHEATDLIAKGIAANTPLLIDVDLDRSFKPM